MDMFHYPLIEWWGFTSISSAKKLFLCSILENWNIPQQSCLKNINLTTNKIKTGIPEPYFPTFMWEYVTD